jgi:hypothetical protein
MKQFSSIDQTMFSDLVQKVFDADFDENFPENGTFLKQKRRNREYHYYKAYETSGGDGPTKTKLKYVGPADEPEIARRVEAFQRSKTGYRVRRDIAAKLRRAGFPSPPHLEGRVVAELAKAGIFRLRAILVGSAAYQTYSGVLGVRLPDELITTGDVDIAQFYGVSIFIDETMPDLENVLKKADRTFEPSPPTNKNYSAGSRTPRDSKSNSLLRIAETRLTPHSCPRCRLSDPRWGPKSCATWISLSTSRSVRSCCTMPACRSSFRLRSAMPFTS